MSSLGSDGAGLGRARGRARGICPTRPDSGEGSHLGELPEQAEGGDEGNGAALRGRGFASTRPANVTETVGSGGTPVKLFANYIKVTTPPNLDVQQYQVEFNPDVESVRIRRGMVYSLTEMFNDAFLFDGMHDLKTVQLLPDEVTERVVVRTTDNVPITITFKRTGTVAWGSGEMLRLFNTQMRRNMKHLKFCLLGRHFFDPKAKTTIASHNIDLWSGILTAINLFQGGTLMVVDTVHKVVRADTVYDVLKALKQKGGGGNFQDEARRELAGSIVMTTYNNSTYKIDDIAFDKNPLYEFDRKGVRISLKDYFKNQYNNPIKDDRQPLITVLPSARDIRAAQGKPVTPILLVPELCLMTGLTDSLKADFNLKKTLTQKTQLVPKDRFQNLRSFVATINANPEAKQEMDLWGIGLHHLPQEVEGRQLACEQIAMQGDAPRMGAGFQQQSGDFSKEIRGKKMRQVTNHLPNGQWHIVYSQRDETNAQDFCTTLQRVCGPLGFNVGTPTRSKLAGDRTGDFINKVRALAGEKPAMIVILVPNNNKERYDSIKKILCCEIPVPSQVIVSRTLAKKQMLMSVCTKVGIQMATKIGNIPWAVHIPPKGLMVVGFDTYHDTTQRNKSVGGFVCSINADLTSWYSRVNYHTNNNEMSSAFKLNMTEGLKRYAEVNKALPTTVVVFRDGVGDGMLSHVFETEVKEIQEALRISAANGGVLPKLAFIVVTKRVNTRFFKKLQQPNLGNPEPGTVVDTTVTRVDRYEFYLVSQSVRQGTVSPTCYNIICDDTNWKPNHHQQLAYKLCHTYFNWMGLISVPAPCQYAHKLAFLTGSSLHREPHVALSNTLWYL